jgi:hypothetical protein
MNTVTIQEQIDYLEAYSKMLKSQADMVDVQIKFLKAGKDIQDNMSKIFPMFNFSNFNVGSK